MFFVWKHAYLKLKTMLRRCSYSPTVEVCRNCSTARATCCTCCCWCCSCSFTLCALDGGSRTKRYKWIQGRFAPERSTCRNSACSSHILLWISAGKPGTAQVYIIHVLRLYLIYVYTFVSDISIYICGGYLYVIASNTAMRCWPCQDDAWLTVAT